MKVTLVTTESEVWALGLRSISAVLKAAGHMTQFVVMATDERQFSNENLAGLASLARQADIIGVSCLAGGSAKAKQLIESLRARKKLIVWGGVHASLNPAECADWADIVCRGEGEGMMLELVERLEQGRDWKDMRNAAFKENGVLQMNGLRPPIADLDELPLPDFSFENEYHLTETGFVQVSTLTDVSNSGRIILNSSRGCAFHCTYCCNRKLKDLYSRGDRYLRRMSVSRLIEYAQSLRKIFPLGKYFWLLDENFGARPVGELAQLAEEFPQKVGLPFACFAHPAQVTQEKMDLLVKAGLFRIYMGIESGSEHTRREIYERHVSNKVVLQAAQTVSRYKQVFPSYFFIIANPYEDRDALTATARLISELPCDSYTIVFNLVFFPGSALYERAVRDNLIEGARDSGYEPNLFGELEYTPRTRNKQDLYLNGLIFLMEGHCTRHRIGILPRSLIRALLDPHWVEFNEKHPFTIRFMVSIKSLLKSSRHSVARWLGKITGNPTAVYNPGYYLRNKFSLHRSRTELSSVDP